MKRTLCLLAVAILFVGGGCTVESKSESCTYNGRPVDCSQMPGHGKDGQSTTPDVSTGDSKPPSTSTGSNFSCNSLSCDSGSQYCLKSVSRVGDALTTECAVLPLGATCATLPGEAKKRFGSSNNCSGSVSCLHFDSQFTVTCELP
jgi:hypothetical protein